jgi:multicomponent Na+:H+ antiporter subunit B
MKRWNEGGATMSSNQRRRLIIAILMVCVFALIVIATVTPIEMTTDLKDYYMQHFIEDTAANNCVAGIYLNYRVFDTLFETLLLLISVIGIIYFSRHEGDY